MPKFVDLYCGGGGATSGLVLAGWEHILGVDNDPWAVGAYRANGWHCSQADLTEEFPLPEHDIIWASPPCQAFSLASLEKHRKARRNDHYLTVAKLAIKHGTEIVITENVPAARKAKPYLEYVRMMKGAGYTVTDDIYKASEYGVATTRRRLITIAEIGNPMMMYPVKHAKARTAFDVIGNLAPLEAGGRDEFDEYHYCANLRKISVDRIEATPVGGDFRDLPDRLLPKWYLDKDKAKGWITCGRRLDPAKPADTLTTRFTSYQRNTTANAHPSQGRCLSIREGARIMGFPDYHRFRPANKRRSITKEARIIGNAVCPPLAKAIAFAIEQSQRIRIANDK